MCAPSDWRLGLELELPGGCRTVHHVNTGVPHAVVFVESIDAIDVDRLGAALRHHDAFAPAGTNANFAERTGARALAIRTFERGVEGETLACGTGVVACALVLAEVDRAEAPVSVRVRGGDTLEVGFRRAGDVFENVTLLGPAQFVFDGETQL
jgi:diaminopimelate epimerase